MLELLLIAEIATTMLFDCKNGATLHCTNAVSEGMYCQPVGFYFPCMFVRDPGAPNTLEGQKGLVCAPISIHLKKNECSIREHRNVFVPNAEEE
jgi:hypothetical protein